MKDSNDNKKELKIKKKKREVDGLLKKKVVKKPKEEQEVFKTKIIEPVDLASLNATQKLNVTDETTVINNDKRAGRAGKRVTVKKKKGKKIGWKIFRVFLFVMIALMIIGGGVAFGVLTGIIEDTSQITAEDMALNENSVMLSSDGKQIATLVGSENRELVKYEELPKHVVDAVIAIEDERYWEHNGVDIKRTAAAIFNYVINMGKSDFGGSTITQQLVKNTTDDRETSWTRKVREWYRAISLEETMSKEAIMQQYLNTIYMGDNSYGIEKAAENYFGKRVTDVNIAEAACLAAIVQAPSSYDPYRSDESRQALISRQQLVLSQMLKLGKITQEQYDEAVNYQLVFTKDFKDENTTSMLSYFADAVLNEVASDLAESKGIPYNTAVQLLYTAGYTIHTTQDVGVQAAIDAAYKNDKLFYTDADGLFMDSAMVVMDQKTGNVLGLIGSAKPKETDRAWNGATQSRNQPGSTMKPLGAYGPAFELGVAAPGTGIDDSYFTLNGWAPKNYYYGYNGYVTCRNALAQSMNIPAIRLTQRVGIDYAWTFAKNCGLKNMNDADKNLASVAIGGSDQGVTVLELCNAYATIANDGVWVEPKLYTKVVDKQGNIILSKESEVKRVMKSTTSYMLTSCLQSVVAAGGTAYGHVGVPNIAVAGKTGNTDGDIDQWFAGYTPYYTIACWNGYDKNAKAIGSRRNLGTYPYTSIVLFDDVMDAICNGKPGAGFTNPGNIVNAEVCKVSGLVATEACKTDIRGSQVGSDMFAKGTVPTATCTIHKTAKICEATGKLAGEFCQKTAEKSYITRENINPPVKTGDWNAMIPTETCDVCKKPPEPEKEEEKDDKDKTDNKNDKENDKDKPSSGNKDDKEDDDSKVDIYKKQ